MMLKDSRVVRVGWNSIAHSTETSFIIRKWKARLIPYLYETRGVSTTVATIFHSFCCASMLVREASVALALILLLLLVPLVTSFTAATPLSSTPNNNKMPAVEPCEVVLVGCGAPSRGMGWYHAEQLLKNKCPSGKLCYIVEPWFLGPGAFLVLFSVLFVISCTYS